MWQDMNSSVRRVAGQALGKCGCGQAVHEEVVLRLQSRHWQDRVEALKLIGYLGSFILFICFFYLNKNIFS
jgi:HEAT repeat protein